MKKELLETTDRLGFSLNGELAIGAFHFRENEMTCQHQDGFEKCNNPTCAGHPPFKEWLRCMSVLQKIKSKIVDPFPWWLASVINYGEHHYGEKYAQAVEVTGLTYPTLANMCYVERNVPPERRHVGVLSFSHHALVASLSPAKQTKYLQMAIEEDMPTMHLRNRIAKHERGVEPPKVVCPFCNQSFTVTRKVEILDANP